MQQAVKLDIERLNAGMNRRSFVVGAGFLTLAQLLAGCQSRRQSTLNVHALKGSMPPQVIRSLRRAITGTDLKLVPETDLGALFTLLQTWKLQAQAERPPGAGLVTLGDYWLATAIRQELIQPLQPGQWQNWSQLPVPWQRLVTRDRQGFLSAQGQVWGAPYRWGMTVLAYRQDKFQRLGWQPTDWGDLWRPELRQRISLLDQAREVIGLTLKKLGRSYNTENLETVANLERELAALDQQTLLYSSDTYLQPLLLGDTWLAVGWSHDLLPVMRRNDQIKIVIPEAGTALWSDIWVQSAALGSAAPISEWMNFWWQPQVARRLTALGPGISPLLTNRELAAQIEAPLLPDASTFERSEFLAPLPAAALDQYQRVWLTLRDRR